MKNFDNRLERTGRRTLIGMSIVVVFVVGTYSCARAAWVDENGTTVWRSGPSHNFDPHILDRDRPLIQQAPDDGRLFGGGTIIIVPSQPEPQDLRIAPQPFIPSSPPSQCITERLVNGMTVTRCF